MGQYLCIGGGGGVRRFIAHFTGFAILTFCLSACITVGPDYAAPEIPMPDAWHEALAEGVATGEADLRTWWTVFDDPVLDSLIQRAASENLSLQIAATRIEQSRSLLGISRSERFPSVNGNGIAERSRASESIIDVPNNTSNLFSLGLSAAWEIDVWGRIRRSVESADASLEAAYEDYRDVLVILYGDIAASYIEARTLQNRIRVAKDNVKNQQDTLGLTQTRFQAGLVSELDVHQAEQNLARTESAIPAFHAGLQQTLNRLSLLLGAYPGEVDALFDEIIDVPDATETVIIGLPLDALRQRPDVRAAERRLAAQTARIGIATADLYPRFSLLGGLGLAAPELNDLFEGDSRTWNVSAPVDWALFSGGLIRSNIDFEEARTQEALIAYRLAILGSIQEAENALTAYIQERRRHATLARSVASAAKSVELVDILYKSGLTDFQNVLDAQRTLTAEEDRLTESEGFRAQALVALYTALGGGWDPVTANIDDASES